MQLRCKECGRRGACRALDGPQDTVFKRRGAAIPPSPQGDGPLEEEMMALRKRTPSRSSRDPRAGWEYITPTHGKLMPGPSVESPVEAQIRGEAAARRVADDVSRQFMFDDRVRSMEKEVCNEMRQRARDLVLRGDPSMPIMDREQVAAPKPGTPQADAFWKGFDWQIKQKFGCVCRPMDEPCAEGEGVLSGLGRWPRR